MAVFRPFFVTLTSDQSRLQVTRKPLAVRRFLADQAGFVHPPPRYDALRYTLGTLTVDGQERTLTLYARNGMIGRGRAEMLNERVAWIELLPSLLVLHANNKPDRFDGAWVTVPMLPVNTMKKLPEDRADAWIALSCGEHTHIVGRNDTSFGIRSADGQNAPMLRISKDSDLHATTLHDETHRLARLHNDRP